jgi:hypothetical protein
LVLNILSPTFEATTLKKKIMPPHLNFNIHFKHNLKWLKVCNFIHLQLWNDNMLKKCKPMKNKAYGFFSIYKSAHEQDEWSIRWCGKFGLREWIKGLRFNDHLFKFIFYFYFCDYTMI